MLPLMDTRELRKGIRTSKENAVVSLIYLPDLEMHLGLIPECQDEQEMLENGCYEPPTTRRVLESITPGMMCIDVGAGFGYYSILLSKMVGDSGRIYALEPSLQIRGYLENNLQLNSVKNVSVHSQALSDSVKWENIQQGAWALNFERRTVIACPMDEVAQRESWPEIDFMKLDTDGLDVSILRGARETLNHSGVSLSVECHSKQLAKFGFTQDDLFQELCYQGFTIYHFWEDKTDIEDPTTIDLCNLWCEK